MKRKLAVVCLLVVALLCGCGEKRIIVESEDKAVGSDSSEAVSTLYRVTAIHTYNPDKEEIRYARCRYDDNGNLISLSFDLGVSEEIWNEQLGVYEYVIRNIDGKTDQEWICVYDENGTVEYEKRIDYSDGDSYSVTEFTYITEYDRSGYLTSMVRGEEREYEYSNNVHGYPLTVNEKYIDRDIERRYTISYIDDDLISEIRIADRVESDEFEFNTSIQFEYNEDGRVIRISYSDTKTGGYKFEYNKAGHLEMMYKLDSDNNKESITEFLYDADGRIKRKTIYDGDGAVSQYSEYEYEAYNVPETVYQNLVSRETWQWYMELLDLRSLQRGYWCSRYTE